MRVIAAHLEWMRLRGRADGTRYQREHHIWRLAAWYDGYRESWHQPGGQSRPDPRGATGDRRVMTPLVGPEDRAGPGPTVLDVTPADLLAWRAGLAIADPSVRTTVAHIRDFYAWLALDPDAPWYRPDNPAARLPVPKRERSLPRPIGEDELMRALRYAPDRVRPWLVLAGWCGLRAREIAWLRRDHVLDRWADPMIHVSHASAKGGHERMVAMPPFVISEIRPLLPSSGWVFPRLDGQPGPNSPWIVSQLSAQVIRQSGTDATLHQLRHRYGTIMLEVSGHNLRMVQEAMGHKDLATTAIYTLVQPRAASSAAALLPVPGGRRLRAVSG